MIAEGRSNRALLERYNMALTNAEQQSQIAEALSNYGYNAAKIAEGRALLNTAETVYETQNTEHLQENQAYALYLPHYESVRTAYQSHRRLAKVVFKNDHVALSALKLTGRTPEAYIKWLDTIEAFYNGILNNTDYLAKMATLNITQQDLQEVQNNINLMVDARTNYQRERGESQDATKAKDQAFADIAEWMSDFYAVARVALQDHPQLLESLDKFVRS